MPGAKEIKRSKSNKNRMRSRNLYRHSWEPSDEFFCSGGGAPGNSALHEDCRDADGLISLKPKSSGTRQSASCSVHQQRQHQHQHGWDQRNNLEEQPQRKSCLRSPSQCYKAMLMFAIVCGVSFQLRSNSQFGKDLLASISAGLTASSSAASNTLRDSRVDESHDKDLRSVLENKVDRNSRQPQLSHYQPKVRADPAAGSDLKSLVIPGADLLLAPSTPLPNPELPGFKNTWEPHDFDKDVPVFWHVPKAGGSTIKDIVGACHGRVIANENGVLFGHSQDTELQTMTIDGQGETRFVNVDTTTIQGIERAKQMGLGNSGLAGLIITPYVHQAATIFSDSDANPKGRLFATFRDPISRAVSMFQYLQYADWEPTYNPVFKTWTLEQYVRSEHIENNWMTRHLSNELEGDLTSAHLQVALDVLRRKFIVGLMNRMDESMQRFEAYFGWRYTINPTAQETCRESLFTVGTNTNRKKIETPTGEVYTLIAQQNVFDIELYKYIEQLFQEQEEFVKDIPKDFRLVNAECSKCNDEDEEALYIRNLRATRNKNT